MNSDWNRVIVRSAWLDEKGGLHISLPMTALVRCVRVHGSGVQGAAPAPRPVPAVWPIGC